MLNRRSAIRLVAVAALCAAAGTAAAAPRVAIGGVRNDPDGAVAASLARTVCGRLDCVDAALVQAGKKIDFATARRNGVDAVLYGTVSQRAAGRVLALALLRDSFKPVKTWALPVDARGRVSGGELAAEVAAVLEPASARAAPSAAEVRSPPPAAERAPVAERAAPAEPAPAAERAPAAIERAPAAAQPEVRRAPRPTSRAGRAEPAAAPASVASGMAAVDVGMGALQRRLTYQGVGASTSALRDFRGGTLVVPSARGEVFPFASSEGAWYAGLGLFAGYARSVGFKTEDSVTGKTFDSVYSALDAGVAYRLRPLGGIGLRLVPAIWYRTQSFEVKSSGGTRLAGLPDSALSGVAVGVDLEVPFARRYAFLAGAGYTVWLTKGDLVSDAFFSSGSAYELGARAGLGVALAGPLSVRAYFDYSRTAYTLSGTSIYRATGATDAYLGGRAVARFVF